MPRPHHNNFNKTISDIHKDNEFNKKLRSLKKYCPQSYKYLIFEFKNGNHFEKEDGEYEINLPTSKEFKFVYGQIKLKYCIKNNAPIYKDLEPSQFFLDGYRFDLHIYKKLYYRNEKDKFKIDLMFELKKGGNYERKIKKNNKSLYS